MKMMRFHNSGGMSTWLYYSMQTMIEGVVEKQEILGVVVNPWLIFN
jgi:hypothetical protein